MSETYADRLERIAGSLPPGPCVLALVPTIAEAHAAGLASDFGQRVAHGREGHTLVFSLEDAPSRLDHEIGVVGGEGLTDVIEGRLRLARAAASGRARGFIYVPAGRTPAAGVELVRSPAWRSLVESALSRGATVIVFMPREVLTAARGTADQPTVRLDGVVWLGPEPAAEWLPWTVFGSLDLPETGPSRAEPPTSRPDDRVRTPDAPSASPAGADAGRVDDPGADRSSPSRPSPAPASPLLVRGASRRSRRERERRRQQILVVVMIVAFLATLALAAIALVDPERREAFFPENDPYWSSPADSGSSPADTAPISPDTSDS